MIKINHSIKTDPKLNDTYVLQFDHLDGHGTNAQLQIEDFGLQSTGIAVFRQSRYDEKIALFEGDIAKICVTNTASQYIKQYNGKNKCFYLIVHFKVVKIIVINYEAKERGKEFDALYNEFFRPLRRKLKSINHYVDYYPRSFAKMKLREDFILGNIDKLDLEIIFRKEIA